MNPFISRLFGRNRKPHTIRTTPRRAVPCLRSNLEMLERRDVPSASIQYLAQGRELQILGDSVLNDRAEVRIQSGIVHVEVGHVTSTGQYFVDITDNYPVGDVGIVQFTGLGGDDEFTNNTSIPSVAHGGEGRDIFIGGSSRDVFHGGNGDDRLEGRQGNDQFDGSFGNDTYVFAGTVALGADEIVEYDYRGDFDTLDFQNWRGVTIDLSKEGFQDVSTASIYRQTVTMLSLSLADGRGIEKVYGSTGNDVIIGNSRDNVLFGLGGNDALVGLQGQDTLFGGEGRDVLIGGTQSDSLYGEAGDDILIGGFTVHDSSPTALKAITAEWGRGDLGYNERVSHLKGFSSGGLNGGNLLKAGATGATVFDDAAADTLFGGAGLSGSTNRDWFFVTANGTIASDTIVDLDPVNEFIN